MPRSADRGTSATPAPGPREGDDGSEVVGGVHQTRLEAGEFAGELHHVVARVAGVGADPVTVGEFGQRAPRSPRRERMRGGQDRVERLRVQRHPGQPADRPRAGAPRYSTATARSASPSSTIGRLSSPSASRTRTRMPGCSPDSCVDGRGQHLGDAGGEGRDRDLAGRAARVRRELRLRPLQLGEDRVRVGEQDLARPRSAVRPGRCGSAGRGRSPAPARRAAGRRRTG